MKSIFKFWLSTAVLSYVVFGSPLVTAQTCAELDGAYVVAQDGTNKYLGFFGSSSAPESIMNRFGSYGAPYLPNSVRNTNGTYGSGVSSYSANNSIAFNPPIIFVNGVARAFLTTNSFKTPGVALSTIDNACTFFSPAPIGSVAQPPAAPSSVLAADGLNESFLSVAWTPASGATSYNVYVATNVTANSGNWVLFGNTQSTSANLTGLSSGVTYYVGVTSLNSVGESGAITYDTGYLATPVSSFTVTPSSLGNGAIGPSSPQTIAANSSAVFALAPDSGYQVASVGGTCGGSLSGNSYTTAAITAACTVIASFEEIPVVSFTVTPSSGVNGSISPTTPQTVQENAQTQFTLTPASGYRVANVGGTCSGSLSGNTFTTDQVTSNCSVQASFEEIPVTTYSVTPSAGAGGSISPSSSQSVASGGTTSFTLSATSGFQIDTVGGTCGGTLSFNTYTTNAISADCTVVASFSALPVTTFAVTPSAGANGAISPNSPQTIQKDSQTQFQLTPSAGYRVASVDGTCGGDLVGNTFTTGQITEDCTVQASFEAEPAATYTVSPSAGTGGTISPNVAQTVAEGSAASFTITPANGYDIEAVAGTCGGSLSSADNRSASRTYTTNAVTAACTVEASFTQITYDVTPSAGANGSISPATAQTIAQGATTTFTVTPDEGYTAAVAGSCGGALAGNTYTTNAVTAACTVEASFTRTDVAVDLGSGESLTLDFSDSSNCRLIPGSAQSESSSEPPSDIASAIGKQVEFSLDSCAASESLSVTVDFGTALPEGAKAYKVLGDSWIEITTATIGETSVTYTLTDNGPYDSNSNLGEIDDPVTVATPVAIKATPVPTLPLYGLLTLGGLLGLFGLRKLKK